MEYIVWGIKFTSTLLLIIYLVYSLVVWFYSLRAKPVLKDNEIQAQFVFFVPGINESSVIGQTILNLLSLDTKTLVIFIDDSSADNSAEIVDTLSFQYPNRVLRLRRNLPDAQTGKGQALNWAVKHLLKSNIIDNNALVAIFDADGRTSRQILIEAQEVFAADSDVVAAQARIRIRTNTSNTFVGKLMLINQDLEFFIVRGIQIFRSRFHFVGMGGNGQFFRWSYLRDTVTNGEEPWPHCLLEDFASGLKAGLSQPNTKLVFLESEVNQQGLTSLRKFVKQRARWALGGYQNFHNIEHILASQHLTKRAKTDLIYFIIQMVINALGILFGLYYSYAFISHLINHTVGLSIILIYIGLGLILPTMWAILYVRENKNLINYSLLIIVSMPIYTAIMMFAVVKAWYQVLKGDFTWAKTARTEEAETAISATD